MMIIIKLNLIFNNKKNSPEYILEKKKEKLKLKLKLKTKLKLN